MSAPASPAPADMFAPPVNRAMKVLDRSFFRKTVPTAAARIFKPQDIARCRKELQLSKDALLNSRIQPIRADPDAQHAAAGAKCLLLKPEIVANGESPAMPLLLPLHPSTPTPPC